MTDTRQVLEEAYQTIHGVPGLAWFDGERGARFRRFLDAEAWTDAALCLVPEGMTWMIDTMDGINEAAVWGPGRVPQSAYHVAETPALALTTAALRAKEAGDA